jgi:hypothetical protein
MDGTGQPGPIDEGLMQRAIASDREERAAMTEPRFDKAIRDNREFLMSERIYMANEDGQAVMESASKCNLDRVLDGYARFIKDINLVGEGMEHLEPSGKSEQAKAQVRGIIDALDKDLIEIITEKCGCKKKE